MNLVFEGMIATEYTESSQKPSISINLGFTADVYRYLLELSIYINYTFKYWQHILWLEA